VTEAPGPLEALARILDAAAVPYAIIGGHAVNAWLEPRFTADVDVTVAADPAALARLRLAGLLALPRIDWSYVEPRAHEWEVDELLRALRSAG
jgi:hypothetical protein